MPRRVGRGGRSDDRILVGIARRKGGLKRGGNSSRAEVDEPRIAVSCPDEKLLAVHEAPGRSKAWLYREIHNESG